MKRTISVFLAIGMLFLACSCASGGDTSADTTVSADVTDETTAETHVYHAVGDSADFIDGERAYQNPIIKVNDKNTWTNYGVGDPFVMRYNGRYYLYCSTKDGEVGVQCWTSDDLVSWKYAGLCAKEKLTKGAFAPEVVYYNGSFYMYTSPAGKGHYVLKSDSPTGPFKAVTDNFGLSIDGDVFIDDSGHWFFYCASRGGIMVYSMTAPDKVNEDSGVLIPCDLNGWTEGSMVVKHNGIYYMTYTGNHVWTAGYRIGIGVSTESPKTFTMGNNNPLLLSTNKDTVMGIGHSSTVLGPNLDEYYIVYHSFKTAPKRSMNIDRIVFNGTDTVVLGATVSSQQAPAMPDVYCRFESEDKLWDFDVYGGTFEYSALVLSDGDKVLSNEKLTGNFTAEYNLKALSGKTSMLFSYIDENNYGSVTYDTSDCTLTLNFTVGGKTQSESFPVSASFSDSLNADALIRFNLIKSGDEIIVYANGRELARRTSSLGEGAIGVLCEDGNATLGFVGGTNGALQSTLSDVYKPIESEIPAFACLGESVELKKYGTVQYLKASAGNKYEYKVNVSDAFVYDISMEYRTTKDCTLEILQNGKVIGEILLGASSNRVETAYLRGLTLAAGYGSITFNVKDGNADVLSFTFHKSETLTETVYDFANTLAVYRDGTWKLENGGLTNPGKFGKYLVGSENWGDYIVESKITVTSGMNAGLCVRTSNPSTAEDNNLSGGSDFLQGYLIGINTDAIYLGKHNYNWKELRRVDYNFEVGKTYTIAVEAFGNVLKISVDGTLVMTYEDNSSPFLHGMVGFRTHAGDMRVEGLTVKPYTE